MKKAALGIFAAALVAGVGAQNAEAQMMTLPLSVEVRGGAGIPLGEFRDEDEANAEVGPGFGVNATYNFTPMLGVYAGYSRFSFGVDTGDVDFGGTDFDPRYITSGFNGGLRAGLAPMGGLSPWVRGGVVYHKLSVDLGNNELNEFCDNDCDTDYALGFEVGGGLDFPLGQVISITPGVRYVRFSPDPTDGGSGELNVSYLAADIGLRFRF